MFKVSINVWGINILKRKVKQKPLIHTINSILCLLKNLRFNFELKNRVVIKGIILSSNKSIL